MYAKLHAYNIAIVYKGAQFILKHIFMSIFKHFITAINHADNHFNYIDILIKI